MLDYIKLDGVGPAHHMEFFFGKRLNVITGDNGLGKSFILDIAWWALTRTWAGEPARPRVESRGGKPSITYRVIGRTGDADPMVASYVPSRKPEVAWILSRRRPPRTGLTLYARVDGGYSVWDPAKNYYANAPSVGVVRPDRAPAFHFTSAQLWNGLVGPEGTPTCNGLIKDWETWQIRKPDIFRQFEVVMTQLSLGLRETLKPGPFLRLDVTDAREIPTIALPYDLVPITLLSAAMRRILSLAYLLVWAWEEHKTASALLKETPTNSMILLIDEIESHLHPQWQRLILPAILDAVEILNEDVKIQVLAVTHSPLVLASVERRFDHDADRLFKLDLVESEVVVEELEWHPLGDVCTWLTSDVFDLGEPRSIEAERAIEAALKELDAPDISMDDRKRIHHTLHQVLGENDPYWMHWVVQARSAGIDP